MKLKFFFICTLAAILTAHTLTARTLTADDITGIKVEAVNRTLQVKVAKSTDEAVQISIETLNGTVIYTESVTRMATWKKYDLQQLEAGDYNLIIENGRTKTIQPFALEFGSIKITETKRITKRLPQITQLDTRVDIRVFVPKKTTVNVKIVDNQGISVFEETKESLSFAKRYDLSRLPSGIYFVEVQADNETQTSTIVLK